MKTNNRFLSIAPALLIVGFSLQAAEIVGGPNGGRLLQTDSASIEFLVTDTHHASIGFLTRELATTGPGTAVVKLIAELPDGRKEIELKRTPAGFVSAKPLPGPEHEPYRVVLQVRAAPGARPANFRVDLDTTVCGGCDRGEYACTCGH